MPYKRLREIGSYKIDPPKERSLQILFSPQIDKGMENCTILMSTLVPCHGRTGVHTHPVDEFIYIISGRGEGEEEGKVYDLVPGTIIYAPAEKKHDCRNFSNEPMQMLCIYVPSLSGEKVSNIINNSKIRS